MTVDVPLSVICRETEKDSNLENRVRLVAIWGLGKGPLRAQKFGKVPYKQKCVAQRGVFSVNYELLHC